MTNEKAGAPVKEKKERKFRAFVPINREACKGCGFCIEFCPLKVLELDKSFNAKGYHPPVAVKIELCNACDLCGLYCPDFAIYAYREKIEAPAGGARP